MKFFEQRDSNSCGVVAVMNARRWMGEQFTYQEVFKKLKKELNCKLREYPETSFDGTHWKDVEKALRKYLDPKQCSIRKLFYIEADEIEKAIKSGRSVILLYHSIEKNKTQRWVVNVHCTHYCFIYGKKDGKFLVANDPDKKWSRNLLKLNCQPHLSVGEVLPVGFIVRNKSREKE